MSDIGKTALKTKIDNKVYENSSQAITGTIMNEILQDVVDTLADGGNLDAGSVDTANIADGAVTDAKLQNPVSVSQNTLSIGGNYAGEMSTTYDVTLHSGQTFTSLSALLSDANLDTLIPTAVRKGGMSIKFVQTSDNKYVQFRYMSSSTAVADFTNTTNWQGVDDEPVNGSKNLAESGGIYALCVFRGDISTPSDVDNTSLAEGAYYVAGNNANMPFTRNGLLQHRKVGNYRLQIATNLYTGEVYSRIYRSSAWQDWIGTWSSFKNYKGSLGSTTNIDSFNAEGVYYLASNVGGTLPANVSTNRILEVSGNNYYCEQTLYDLDTNSIYVRSANGALPYSSWDKKIGLSDIEPLLEKVTELENKNNIQTRNLWPLNTDIRVTEEGVTYGTEGTTLIPAGTYILSFEATQQTGGESLGANWTGYYANGSISIINKQKSTDGRIIKKITFEYDVERIYSHTNGDVEDNIDINDIQLEVLEWNGYSSNPQKGDWKELPYATPFISPKVSPADYAKDLTHSPWEGKTINYNGDSITQGSGWNIRTGWVKVVNQIIRPSKVNNYAIGGTRLAHVDDVPNCMVDRYQDMSPNADIVVIMANTNDYASQVPIGASDSQDPTTYNGAMNIIFSWLRTTYPTQPIIISSMLTRYNSNLPITIEQYAEAVKAKVHEYKFIFYDAYYDSGLDLLNSPRDGSGITDDGLHPNKAGALALGRKLAAFINAQ